MPQISKLGGKLLRQAYLIRVGAGLRLFDLELSRAGNVSATCRGKSELPLFNSDLCCQRRRHPHVHGRRENQYFQLSPLHFLTSFFFSLFLLCGLLFVPSSCCSCAARRLCSSPAMAKDVFSVPVFLVVFRETLETVIIVSVLLAFLKQTLDGPNADRATYKKLRRQVNKR